MEYQISNEVSEFWYELVPPVFLGALSIMCFLWVVGKENRFRLMKRFVEGKDNIFVEENGILIPKNETIRCCFYKKLVKYTGLDSIRPLAAIFSPCYSSMDSTIHCCICFNLYSRSILVGFFMPLGLMKERLQRYGCTTPLLPFLIYTA